MINPAFLSEVADELRANYAQKVAVGSARLEWDEIALMLTQVQLSRARYLIGSAEHFIPMGDPARHATKRKYHGE